MRGEREEATNKRAGVTFESFYVSAVARFSNVEEGILIA